MADPRTMTAGSEVADTLQGILARKRELERQSMLDQLAAQEQQSVQSSREAETKRLGEATAAQIAESGERTFQSKLGNVRRGTTSSNIQDEALRNEMMNRGLMETRGIQGPTLTGEGDLGSVTSYRGTQKEEDMDRLRSTLQERAAENPEMAAGLDIVGAGGPEIQSLLARRVNPVVYDQDTGRSTTVQGVTVPENDAFHVGTRKPVGYGGGAANVAKPYQIFDGTGKEMGTQWLTPAEGQEFEKTNPGFVARPVGFQPKNEPTIPATLRNQVTNSQYALSQAQGNDKGRYFSSFRDPSNETNAAQAAFDTAIGQLVAADPNATPNVVEAVRQIMTTPELAGATAAEIELVGPDGAPIVLTPQEIAVIDKILVGMQGMSQGNQ